MPTFGSFETDREIYSDPVCTSYAARKSGDAQYAIKVFHIQQGSGNSEESGGLVNPAEITRSRVESVAVQEKGAAASAFIAPILETGRDERGVWYATRFYPRSVDMIINGRVAIPREALRHIVLSVAQGALDLQRACGRSHGGIRPPHVQISRSEKLSEAQVVLSDPLPGDASEAERYEKADLRAIGELIYQLTFKRTVDFAWMILPLAATPEWPKTFGKKDSARWLGLCNRLLDPNLSLDRVNLASLARELQPSERSKNVPLLAAALVGLCMLGGAGYLGFRALSAGSKHEAQKEQIAAAVTRPASDCAMAKKLAEQAEGKNWSLAASQWVEAQGKCPGDGEVLSGVKFAEAMTNALAKLSQARERANGGGAGLQQTAKLCDEAIASLQESAGLATSAVRTAESYLRKAEADKIRKDASDVVALRQQQQICAEAKNAAITFEQAKQWPEAMAGWIDAQKKCPGEPAIQDGVRFSRAMVEAAQGLLDAQARTSGAAGELEQATNLCVKALDGLRSIEALAATSARRMAWSERTNEIQRLWQTAAERIAKLNQQKECSMARQSAQKAEGDREWLAAAGLWNKARERCQDAEIDRDIAFATAMSNGAEDLANAQRMTNGQVAAAQAAGELCVTAQGKLVAQISWNPGKTRSEELQRLTGEFAKVRLASDRVLAEDWLSRGEYANALQICARQTEFTELKGRIQTEQTALRNFEQKLRVGDYSFLAEAAPYGSRTPFTNLLASASREKVILEGLASMKKTNNWHAVMRSNRADPSAGFWSKPPFEKVFKWAKAWEDSEKARAEAAELLGRPRRRSK